MKLIDKSALVAEIDGRISINETCQKISGGHDFYRGAIDEAKEIISIIDTLEVKEVDLEKEVDDWYSTKASKEFENVFYRDIEKFAKHFFELGLQSTLTEEDIKLIWTIGDDIPYMAEEDFFEEILKRFKAQKGEEV